MELSSAQEQKIIDAWNSGIFNLKELTQIAWGGDFDGRSDEGKLVKLFLASRNLRAKASSDENKKTSAIVLTEEHKLYIANNISLNTPLEIAKILFNNHSLTNLNAEARVVNDFVKSLEPKTVFGGRDILNEVPSGEYEPPRSLDKAVKKINEYKPFVPNASALNAQEKKNTEKLIEYLSTYRFIRLMNTFESTLDRKSCEDAFIRFTYDKPDLTQEEIDQYISLSEEIVHGVGVKRRIEKLSKQLEQISDTTPESQKYKMGLVEAVGKFSTEYHQCKDRQKKLLDVLTQKRSERLDLQIKDNGSVLNLVQAWRQEQERVKFLRYAELEQQSVAKEIERLETLPEFKARIMGMSKEQALYG